MTKKTIRIFLSYAFTSKQNAYSQSEIKEVLQKAIKSAKKKIGNKAKDLNILEDFELTEYGGVLKAELLAKISAADILIVDISDNNPNVFYELGYVDANKKSVIIMKSNKGKKLYKIPSDIADRFYLEYEKISSIKEKLAESLKKRIEEILKTPKLSLAEIQTVWFPENITIINIIGPPSQRKTLFSKIQSPNYVYLDRLGDKDAMIEIMILLSRLYPSAKIRKIVANDFPDESLDENLVIVGGAGTDEEPGNNICKTITEKINTQVSYINFEKMKVKGKEFLAEYDKNKKIIADHGYFARIPNPLNPRSTVIMIHGIHTYGVLGASRALSDQPLAIKNIQKILDKIGLNPYFESWFRVDVLNGIVKIPEIKNFHIL